MFRNYILPGLLGFAGTLALAATKIFATDFNQQPAEVRIACYAGPVISICSAAVAIWNGASAQRAKRANDAYVSLLAALTKIVDAAKVPAADLGLSAYLVRRSFWRPWCVRQERIARVRLSNFPPRCTIEWKEGKGVVGQCWKAKDRTATFIRANSEYLECTEEDWLRAPDDVRMGLTYEDWRTTQRYAYIMAYPVHRRDKYAGCVSIDTSNDDTAGKIQQRTVYRLIGDAAHAVEKSLGTA